MLIRCRRLDFPGVYQAFRIHRQIYDLNWNPLRKPETVHGITSLTAWQANPADILAGNRGHWGVENREHYVRDRTFDEDRSQVRTGASPQFLATARNIVMSLLRLAGCENVARGMEYLSRRLDQILALLGVLPEPIRKGDAYTTTLPMTLPTGQATEWNLRAGQCQVREVRTCWPDHRESDRRAPRHGRSPDQTRSREFSRPRR